VRGALRVGISVVIVAALSAGITRLLPFHEVNAEIAARATPTVLDLGTAVFCAIAGVYAALRPSSDVATTAAGTSIGISLVPPLCVSGYGIGTRAWDLATGASMLFLTNFVAIVLVGTLVFAMAGFGQVDLGEVESDELERGKDAAIARAVVRGLARLFRSPTGPVFRALMPVALLAAVYSPLRSGLNEVAWQIESRAAIESAISALPGRVVESRLRVDRRQVELVIFLLGTPAEASSARESLAEQIGTATGVTPRVDVFAVPNASEFEALERSLQKPPALPAAPPAPAEPPAATRIVDAHATVADTLDRRWPHAEAGEMLGVEIATGESHALRVRVVHWGAPLARSTVETLERVLSDDLETELSLVAEAIPEAEVDLTHDDGTAYAQVAAAVAATKLAPEIHICIVEPAETNGRTRRASAAKIAERERTQATLHALRALLRERQGVETASGGERIGVRFTRGACFEP
jgi:hypothetical protein